MRALGQIETIDLRERAEFEAGHLPGALNVPMLGLDGYLSRAGTPAERPLLRVCAHGVNAALATPTARLYRADVLSDPAALTPGERASAQRLRSCHRRLRKSADATAKGSAPMAGDSRPRVQCRPA